MRRCAVREKRRTSAPVTETLLLCVVFGASLLFARAAGTSAPRPSQSEKVLGQTYLGFDANDYPGDEALPALATNFHVFRLLAECAARRKSEFLDREAR